MSGGHFNYVGSRLANDLLMISDDEEVNRRWPAVGILFVKLAESISKIEKEMDLDICGDAYIVDDQKFSTNALSEVLHAVMSVCPDEWFPRGKWATIQAVQGRAEQSNQERSLS